MGKVMQVFDPAMCCSTGVCGPAVDPVLVRFSGDLDWLAGKGVKVMRYNLSQQPEAFVQNSIVVKTLSDSGTECLPMVIVDNTVKAQGKYPTRAEMAAWLGVAFDPAVDSSQTQGFGQTAQPLPLKTKKRCC